MKSLELVLKIKSLESFVNFPLLQQIVFCLEQQNFTGAEELVESHRDKLRDKDLRFIPEAIEALVVASQARYDELADYLSDHLWQRNTLNYDFLKTFPEFLYKGEGYRVHFLDKEESPGDCVHKSFAKTLSGVKEFIYNAQTYDKDFVLNRKPFVFKGQITGFDVQAALQYFKRTRGLTEDTITNFLDEEEVIAFSHSDLTLVNL